ncbi:MAG TPA: GTP-binding protein [Epsilonproteobacteria bacterium]|nr:GTP-binding protein [Campylobacterota bacterium]
MIRKKILLIGDFAVGKTSLIRRYVDNAFDDNYLTTIGVKISKKNVAVEDDSVELLIWDIEGATVEKRIPTNYFKGASGAIFVCDMNRTETVEALSEHIESFLEVNPKGKYKVAYNKADLYTASQSEPVEVMAGGYLTSAKDGRNVETIFSELAKEMSA